MFASTTDLASLPAPSQEALQRSGRLADVIRNEIRADGPMTLGQFVHHALYEPGLGYYAGGARKFGEHGDFVTAPELGSVFAECIARGISRVFDELESSSGHQACVLELGAGSGRFAFDCLLALETLKAVPRRYFILEVSADLRGRQEELLSTLPNALFQRIEWLSAPPAEPFEGVIFANEVIDALPMERFGLPADGQFCMEYIGIDETSDRGLTSLQMPANDAVVKAVAALRTRIGDESPWTTPYAGEVRVGLGEWLASITGGLERGAVLIVDYGTDARELYRPDRIAGTLLCHYRHRAHDQVLLWPGLQDITCWVDFSQLAASATALGLELNGYGTQAHSLIDLELDDVVGRRFENASTPDRLRLSSEVKQLTLPGEMGERFKAMSLSRGLSRGLLSPAHMGLERRL